MVKIAAFCSFQAVAVTVEGDLSAEKIESIRQHGVKTYAKLEGVPYKSVAI